LLAKRYAAVKATAGDLPRRPQILKIRPTFLVRNHATNHVVSTRTNGYTVPGQIQSEIRTHSTDMRKPQLHPISSNR
jgi:hypothetical protein